jgi:uncharacterized protein Smg (DUF494 family)
MKHSVTDIVDVILRRLQEHPEALPSEKGLRSWLSRQGYNKREIDAAIKLVKPGFPSVPHPMTPTQTQSSVRLLSILEEYKLTPEARNALARLELYGLLDPYDREMILDYLNHMDGEVGLDELDYLLSWMVCSGRDVAYQQTLFDVFEGKKDTKH